MNPQPKPNPFLAFPGRVTMLSLLLLGGVGYFASATPPQVSPPTPATTEQAIQGLERSGQAFASIAKKISPAVVSLKVEKKVADSTTENDHMSPFDDEVMKRFFGDKLPEQFRQRKGPQMPHRHGVVGQGSGFIVSPDGYILTNHHVVADTTKVTVKLADGREMLAKVIGSDSRSDVAVIKVDTTNLPTIPLGDSTKTEVGEWVLASGAPYGLTQTVTAGIVSAVGRNSVGITDYENFIQTDAAINPGNSGGPLVNLRGEAIGINTAIFSRTGGSVGLGFAIPIDMAKQAYEQIVSTGSVTRGYLGVGIQPLTPEMAAHFGLKDDQGVLISEVKKGAPGEKAGLKQADVIVELNGQKIDQAAAFRNAIGMKAPGDKVNLTVMRDGHKVEVPATLGKLPESTTSVAAESGGKQSNSWGFSVQPLTADLAKKFGYSTDSGLIISEVAPDSPASEAGLEPGMLIQQVNRDNVKTTDEFNEAVHKDKDSKSLLLLVSSPQGSRYVVLKSGS